MKVITESNQYQTLNNVEVGENVRFFNFVNAYGCSVDDNSKFPPDIFIESFIESFINDL